MNTVIPLHAFKDNYIWLIPDVSSKSAWVVDPGDAAPVLDFLQKNAWELAGILLTHHHADHSGGIKHLVERYVNIPVYGSHISTVPFVSHRVKEGDVITCGTQQYTVMEIPGHTLDHLAYYNSEMVFCGDTLFSAGCGRVFEGTYEQMYRSLCKLIQLDDEIKIYCGHEYTLQNLLFAEHVEPDNQAIQQKIMQVKQLLAQGHITLPANLANEKKINPFLRCTEPKMLKLFAEKYNLSRPEEIFKFLREWKNRF